ncbi:MULTISPECIES: phosphate signaling complex protein PhoU [unclassified Isoptericola]|uniref:phosphate signaling complex protein PhoU n=1 Tax=unclassified Isoptericola TaxID=2623355 RepID=UPI00271440C6|nr:MULTISPECIES: phosphate signaling complex protein PhoU [unclassified Isoptericola]MDO8143880.1 phosphate signaling complex protein PhoU [Isoptericola sp. 178]MDO8149304.1 phosphate signaling complex protein PhoU [Isoptericola sp. b515]MDO8152243.1 phosphate signaling complex protein PhoU [Isoptericola sp. b408]
MREIFDAELKHIGDGLVEMSRLVESAITRAGTALLDGEHQLAQDVIASDHEIDRLERELDERCVHVLAQQAPVATDLRVVITALRISSTLERMGDLARHVAEVARGRYPALAVPDAARETFVAINEAAGLVARRTSELLSTRDVALAAEIEAGDDVIDRLHQDTFAATLSPDWTGTAQETIDVTLLARYYERFGDHGVSVARRITYLVTGDFEAEIHAPADV